MNKEQYMKELRKRLRRLPREDFESAIEYYEEYFADAGAEREGEAIVDLGTPEEAANAIIREFAIENAKKPNQNVKNSFHAVWVGILAVCAGMLGLGILISGVGYAMGGRVSGIGLGISGIQVDSPNIRGAGDNTIHYIENTEELAKEKDSFSTGREFMFWGFEARTIG